MDLTKSRFFCRTVTIFSFALALWLSDKAQAALEFPVPPQQYAFWKAPSTKLPPQVVAASRHLFVSGLADPRGCDYREITIITGDVWGRVQETKTHGWVLPQGNFAITWSGLIYPLKAAGARASLRDDLFNLSSFEIRQAPSEAVIVGCPPRSLLGVCLLLRLGESAGAENLWRAARRAPLPKIRRSRIEPLAELGSQWAWAIWDRALCAHLRGDDELALRDARQVKHLQFQIEGKVREDQEKAKNKNAFRLHFLAPLRSLLADQERRAIAGSSAAPGDIAELIANLENISVRQWGQPGGVDLTTAPVVQELIAYGNPAVPFLLQTIAQDYRLTRSVSFHRDYFTGRHVVGVAEAAYIALCKITGQAFGPVESVAAGGLQRRALVQRIRTWWQFKNSSLPIVATKQVATKPVIPKPAITAKTAAPNFVGLAAQIRKKTDDLSRKKQPLQDFQLFQPLWHYPQAVPLANLANDLFNGANPQWNPLVDPRRAGQWNAAVAGPLLSIPAYRVQVARQLKNWSACGTIEVLAGGKLLIRTARNKIEEELPRDGNAPSIGEKNEFRICDFYGWQLSQIAGAPRCELYWGFEKRDRAVAAIGEWLQTYGALLRPAPGGALISESLPAQIAFPLLKRNANLDDVKRHAAIFSLQGLGKTRLVPLKLPAYAKWKNQGVTIWQAEEVAVDSQWRRHYGIVASHEIRRVPASEIQLVKDN